MNDTVKINEVVISSNRINSNQTGYKKISIDSSVIEKYSHGNVADVLSENSRVFIKSYGMGGSASTSFRGTSASQTLITWNSINLNSPMLGQTDISLLPAGMIDDIQIYFGGASMILNSGGFGGIVNLETRPVWKKETSVIINPGIGSYGRYTGLVKVRTGNNNFQTITKAYFQTSENNFRYLNTQISSEPIWEIRKNSEVKQQGLMQELYFCKSKSIASLKIWYQEADRNLPASMVVQDNPGEKQADKSLRTLLNYDVSSGRSDYSFAGAFLFSSLNYTNPLASIDSRNISETVILKAGMESRIGDFAKLKLTVNEELSIVKSNNYFSNQKRNTASFTVSAERNKGERVGAFILLRELIHDFEFLLPDFSAGIQFRLFEDKKHFLKTNISRNSKVPTMNDVFWVPGGNPDLKNEYAIIYELIYEMNQKVSDHAAIKYDMSLFRNAIKDMIQWRPGDHSYWTADNIQYVNSMGLESSFTFDYVYNRLKTRLIAGYSYTKAISVGSESLNKKQLIYIPENQANTILNLYYRNIYSSFSASANGKRYITADNSKYLPGYLVCDFLTGIKFKFKDNSVDLSFTVDNLFNANYQAIAFYPLPGRSYSAKILINIIK